MVDQSLAGTFIGTVSLVYLPKRKSISVVVDKYQAAWAENWGLFGVKHARTSFFQCSVCLVVC